MQNELTREKIKKEIELQVERMHFLQLFSLIGKVHMSILHIKWTAVVKVVNITQIHQI